MTSAVLEVQKAIVARLKADPAVDALVGGRVFDHVKTGTEFPYISCGGADETEDDADCIEALEISLQLDCWSRTVGFPEVRVVSAAARAALHDAALALTDNALVSIRHRQTRTFRDPDGLTNHAAMTFDVIVELA